MNATILAAVTTRGDTTPLPMLAGIAAIILLVCVIVFLIEAHNAPLMDGEYSDWDRRDGLTGECRDCRDPLLRLKKESRELPHCHLTSDERYAHDSEGPRS